MSSIPIRFVYHRRKRNLGSTVMRAHQLAAILRPQLPDTVSLALSAAPFTAPGRLLWLRQQPRNAVFFVTKAALKYLTEPFCHAIRRRGGVICADYVDIALPDAIVPDADVHVASSFQQLDALRAMLAAPIGGRRVSGVPLLLLHNADARLYDLDVRLPDDRLRTVYVGRAAETFLDAGISDVVTTLEASDSATMAAALRELPKYNFHYCVRAIKNLEGSGLRRFKPATKLAVAASIGANVVADRRAGDTERLLGADYPYLVERHDEREILATIAAAADDFGGPRWQLAAERMAELSRLVSPASLAGQFKAILAAVGR